jgi:quercetin dioxygenase-like cupin family protein
MRSYLILLSGAAAVFAIAAIVDPGHSQEVRLAPEGRGLIPEPTAATPAGPTRQRAFLPHPSGASSRITFETNDSPDFKLVIRDFTFAPDRQLHTVTLPSAAFLHLLSGNGEVRIANQRTALTPLVRTAAPAGAPIEITNSSDYPLVIRALIVEAK